MKALGPECDECGKFEAACARLDGCCDLCTHWADLDALGNTPRMPAKAVRAHGTEDAYRRHLERGSQPCTFCRMAHRRFHVQELAAAIRDPYHFDALYRECVPHRLIPTPSTRNGPTAQWMKAHPGQDLGPSLTVVAS